MLHVNFCKREARGSSIFLCNFLAKQTLEDVMYVIDFSKVTHTNTDEYILYIKLTKHEVLKRFVNVQLFDISHIYLLWISR